MHVLKITCLAQESYSKYRVFILAVIKLVSRPVALPDKIPLTSSLYIYNCTFILSVIRAKVGNLFVLCAIQFNEIKCKLAASDLRSH